MHSSTAKRETIIWHAHNNNNLMKVIALVQKPLGQTQTSQAKAWLVYSLEKRLVYKHEKKLSQDWLI